VPRDGLRRRRRSEIHHLAAIPPGRRKAPPAAFSTAPEVVQADDARKATPGATRSASSSGAWRRSTRVAATGEIALTRMSVSASSAANPTIHPTGAILAVE
jgi:hypothetical protein